jgi:3-deoxy-D-manno-octulosonate 8-phosphate phosphatase (KDO 8-P phosphatase)
MPPPEGTREPGNEELQARASAVELLVLDVDGVLTDGSLYYGEHGEAMKRFDVKDGHGLVMARLVGLRAAILTARTSKIVERRGKELGLALILQGQKENASGLSEILHTLGVHPQACAYMGDDLNDLAPMGMVGLSACPVDAAAEVRRQALFVAQSPGGKGAVRELVELCLRASGRWEQAVSWMFRAGNAPSG